MVIKVEKLNEVHLRVWADDFGIENEIYEFFSFFVEGYKWMPKFKAKLWDGKTHLYDVHRKLLPVGLIGYLERFADSSDYEIEYKNIINQEDNYSFYDIKKFCETLNIHSKGKKIEFRYYQIYAIQQALNKKRCILKAATSSGKSLIIFSIFRWHIANGRKCLFYCPSTGLIEQMFSDFKDYSSHNGWDVDANCSKYYSGKLKDFSTNCVMSTWQSLYKQSKSEFQPNGIPFDVVIGDECHMLSGQSATTLMNNLTEAEYRIGTTGTLNGKQITELQLTGLFGEVINVISTKEMMDNKQSSQLNIECLVLNHNQVKKDLCKKLKYADEMKFLTLDIERNKFIRNLSTSLNGMTLVLFNYIVHGKELHKLITGYVPDRVVHFISGNTDTIERDNIRMILNNNKKARKFYFGEVYILIEDSELVLLADGSNKNGYLLGLDDDISNDWIKTKKMNKD